MKVLSIFLGICVVLVSAGMYAQTAGAVARPRWSTGDLVVSNNSILRTPPDESCAGQRQMLFVADMGSQQNVCVYGDERLKIGVYAGARDKAVVIFPYSTTAYALDNICHFRCQYSAENDVLVTLQPLGRYGVGLIAYSNASRRISVGSSDLTTTRYTFDASNPDYAMKNDVGKYMFTPTFSLSRNGEWAAVELRDNGTALLHLNPFSVRHISTYANKYGYGMDPMQQMAISENGTSAAVNGQNTSVRVYDVDSSCGQPLIGNLNKLPTTVECPHTDLGLSSLFPNFAFASRPRFYGNGSQLEMTVSSWVDPAKSISFLKPGAKMVQKLEYLALGDSFTSGEGESDDGFYQPGTNMPYEKCHLSNRAYPTLVWPKLAIHSDKGKNVACSGARIADIVGRSKYRGQTERLGSGALDLTDSEMVVTQEEALETFYPGRVLQSEYIDRYTPGIITVGIGGNDAGLMGKLRTCSTPGTCEWAVGEGIKQTAGEISGLGARLIPFFGSIAEKAKDAEVFVTGYPNIIDPYGQCDPATSLLLNQSERVFIQHSIRYVNSVIRTAAVRAGFTYVDLERSLGNARLCQKTVFSAMNGIRFGDDIAVTTVLPMLKIVGAETFHPTPLGQVMMADAFTSQYQNRHNSSVPALGSGDVDMTYWVNDGVPLQRAAYVTDFALMQKGSDRSYTISLPKGSLRQHASVRVEIRSEPMQLLNVNADDNGGLSTVVTVPESIHDGYHTLHLLSQNSAGEEVDLYQFITVGNEKDVSIEQVPVVTVTDTPTDIDPGPEQPAMVAIGRSILAGIEPAADVPRKQFTESGEVLGVVADTQKNAGGIKGMRTVATRAQLYFDNPRWKLGVGIGLFAVGLTTVLVILLMRRWAKSGT